MSLRISAVFVMAATLALGCDQKSSGEDPEPDEARTERKSKKSKKDKGADGDSKAAGKTDDGTRKAVDEGKTIEGKAPDQAVNSPDMQTYPDGPIKQIADHCSKPFVIMSTAPNSVGDNYPWTWTRQAMLANQQFKVVDGEPAGPGQVSFQLHLASDKYQNAWVLVAKCKDGGTCNKLAAMYKAIVKGSQSQPVCGKLPLDLSPVTFKKPVLREAGFSSNTLPEKTDVKGMCARLQACTVATDTSKSGKETIGFDCQKAPSSFKTSCARKYPCQAVMDCLSAN
jgi:hypothetical protein